MTDNRTTELRISEPLRGFIRHQSNRAYIDGGQARWLTDIADKIDVKHEQAIAATLGSDKPPYDELLRCLENDWHIRASWDGLRKFWCIELTEEGVRLRDAELGSGTCKITATATNNLMYPDYMTKWYELSCGHSLTLKGDEAPKWCAVCGKAVER